MCDDGYPSEYCKCISCGKQIELKLAHAGHFIPRVKNATLFHEKNVHAQCCSCNTFLEGNTAEYWPAMVEKYGEETVEELRCLSKQTKIFELDELKKLHASYKEKIEEEKAK